ncbi:MAG: NADH:ubiquinone reductase (Na(+)-transporting) subunit F [Hyphomicrobiales bacterium]|nr:NADH:ubiquinone reductase (Na(+)-transporting) subunit F [Hyphomicrobiales bacterium]
MSEILLGSISFSLIVLALAIMVLAARMILAPSRKVTIVVNDQRSISTRTGEKLLTVLRDAGISIPSTCAGVGTCGLCRVQVSSGGGDPLPTETARIARREIRKGTRLACQVTIRETMHVEVPENLLSAEEFECTVVEGRFVSPLIREVVLALPPDRQFEFEAGSYVQITVPAYNLQFANMKFPAAYVDALAEIGVKSLTARSNKKVTRAYSIANTPADAGRIVLLIRLALPPPNHADVPPGVVSSYLFGVTSGDKLSVSGPYGDFRARQSEHEMVFIGGGVGMAPLRAIIFDQLEQRRAKREMSFWYGARSRADLIYEHDFARLAAEHDNFTWTAALSDPKPGDAWDGPTGFIHTVVYERYLKSHPVLEQCEFYLCGPPLMMQAVLSMLEECGVDEDSIFFDDFGSSPYGAE